MTIEHITEALAEHPEILDAHKKFDRCLTEVETLRLRVEEAVRCGFLPKHVEHLRRQYDEAYAAVLVSGKVFNDLFNRIVGAS